MKQEWIKQLLAVLSTLACIALLDFGVGLFFDGLLKRIPNEGERVAKSNYIITKLKADIVVIGSSRAECHYDSRIIKDCFPGKTVYNCGVDDQGLYYQFVAINSLLDRYTPEVVIWDIQSDELERSGSGNLSLLYPYYYKNDYIKKYIDKETPSIKYYMWLNSYRYNGTASRIVRAFFRSSADSTRLGFGGRDTDVLYPVPPEIIVAKDGPINQARYELFLDVVKRLNDSGTKLIIVESPLYDTHIGASSTIKELQKLAQEGMFVFIDDSQLPELLGKSEYMLDNIHLNNAGAKIFTEILCGQLKDLQQ